MYCCEVFLVDYANTTVVVNSSSANMATMFVGPVVHSLDRNEITIVPKGVVAVQDGMIIALDIEGDCNGVANRFGWNLQDCRMVMLERGQFLCPGLVDLHTHAPQFPNSGLGYDRPLLQWLQSYTFPMEKKYGDLNFANRVYSGVVDKTLSNGTTTACYYGTIHKESCISLANIMNKSGQRGLIGKINMNTNCQPDYCETTESSVKDTEEFIHAIKALKTEFLLPVVTPRFAITCDSELLSRLGVLARLHNLHIQTHLSENKDEVQLAKQLFPDCRNYTDIYNRAGLLTKKTILGHAVHLTPEEMEVLAKCGASVAHCPNSNTSLRSGNCDVRRLLSYGVNVGLGTDVSGGYSSSILDAMRQALITSIHISFMQDADYTPLSYHEAFHLATVGGARALAMEDKIGIFDVGKKFDALIVDMDTSSAWPSADVSEAVQKFVYTGDDRNILQVYVNGRLVKTNGTHGR